MVSCERNAFSGIWNSVNQCGHLLLTGLDLLLSNLFVSPYAMGVVAVSKKQYPLQLYS